MTVAAPVGVLSFMKMKILCTPEIINQNQQIRRDELFVTRIVPARQKKSEICDFVTVDGRPVM